MRTIYCNMILADHDAVAVAMPSDAAATKSHRVWVDHGDACWIGEK
jgi:hypothetical protein